MEINHFPKQIHKRDLDLIYKYISNFVYIQPEFELFAIFNPESYRNYTFFLKFTVDSVFIIKENCFTCFLFNFHRNTIFDSYF